MVLCLVVVYISRLPTSFPPLSRPFSRLPRHLGHPTRLEITSYTHPQHFRHPIAWFIRSFLKQQVDSCLVGCIIAIDSYLDMIYNCSIHGWMIRTQQRLGPNNDDQDPTMTSRAQRQARRIATATTKSRLRRSPTSTPGPTHGYHF